VIPSRRVLSSSKSTDLTASEKLTITVLLPLRVNVSLTVGAIFSVRSNS